MWLLGALLKKFLDPKVQLRVDLARRSHEKTALEGVLAQLLAEILGKRFGGPTETYARLHRAIKQHGQESKVQALCTDIELALQLAPGHLFGYLECKDVLVTVRNARGSEVLVPLPASSTVGDLKERYLLEAPGGRGGSVFLADAEEPTRTLQDGEPIRGRRLFQAAVAIRGSGERVQTREAGMAARTLIFKVSDFRTTVKVALPPTDGQRTVLDLKTRIAKQVGRGPASRIELSLAGSQLTLQDATRPLGD